MIKTLTMTSGWRNGRFLVLLLLIALLLSVLTACGTAPQAESTSTVSRKPRNANGQIESDVMRAPPPAAGGSTSGIVGVTSGSEIASVPASDVLVKYSDQEETVLWSEYVQYLENNFNRLDALHSKGLRGGEPEKWTVAGCHLWLARAQKEYAEGHRGQALADLTKAFAFAKQSVQDVTAAYETGSAIQADLFHAAELRLLTGRALLALRRSQGNTKSEETLPTPGNATP